MPGRRKKILIHFADEIVDSTDGTLNTADKCYGI